MDHPPEYSVRTDSAGLISRLLFLALVLVVAGVLLISLGVFVFGTSFQAGLMAWAVCGFSALAAHIGGEYPRGPYNFAARLAIQMLVRTVFPFAFAIGALKFVQPPLETSLVFYILAFYIVGLVADVQLHVARLKSETIRSEHFET